MRAKRTAKTARKDALKHLAMAAANVAIAAIDGELDLDANDSALAGIEEAIEALTDEENKWILGR